MTHLIATFFYVGHIRPGPGTWGSLAALPFGWALHEVGGPWLLLLSIVALFLLGFWATREETRGKADHDPSHIVVDEVAGQWVALLPLSFGAASAGVAILALWPGWLAAFALFRLFDIWKRGPVGWADSQPGPWGVMLDDIVAGVMAAVCVTLLAALAHGALLR